MSKTRYRMREFSDEWRRAKIRVSKGRAYDDDRTSRRDASSSSSSDSQEFSSSNSRISGEIDPSNVSSSTSSSNSSRKRSRSRCKVYSGKKRFRTTKRRDGGKLHERDGVHERRRNKESDAMPVLRRAKSPISLASSTPLIQCGYIKIRPPVPINSSSNGATVLPAPPSCAQEAVMVRPPTPVSIPPKTSNSSYSSRSAGPVDLAASESSWTAAVERFVSRISKNSSLAEPRSNEFEHHNGSLSSDFGQRRPDPFDQRIGPVDRRRRHFDEHDHKRRHLDLHPEEQEKEQVDVSTAETARRLGLDAEGYLEKLEEQKRLRETMLKIKELRRQSELDRKLGLICPDEEEKKVTDEDVEALKKQLMTEDSDAGVQELTRTKAVASEKELPKRRPISERLAPLPTVQQVKKTDSCVVLAAVVRGDFTTRAHAVERLRLIAATIGAIQNCCRPRSDTIVVVFKDIGDAAEFTHQYHGKVMSGCTLAVNLENVGIRSNAS